MAAPIVINETTNFTGHLTGVTNPQGGTLFLCETQNLALATGNCSDRSGAATSDEVVFVVAGPSELNFTMQSDIEPGEVNPEPADLENLTFPTPFVSISEPNGNIENTFQTLAYTPLVGQPGFFVDAAYSITSDVPEPASLSVFSASLGGLWILLRRRHRVV
jgi:hypothetical protein